MIRKVQSKHTRRIKEHNLQINRTKQVQKKVDDASKALIQVGFKTDNVKVKPKSGNFKVISDEMLKLNVGDKIKSKGNVATLTDHNLQVDTNKVPFIEKKLIQYQE